MANLDKRLRGFYRIDGSQRAVPNSLVLRKNKPKVGKWIEVDAWECCGGTTTTTTTVLLTTTTSTTLCPEGCIYEGIMTVGTNGLFYGYARGEDEFGSITPPISDCDGVVGIIWHDNGLGCYSSIECEGDIILSINNINYELHKVVICVWELIDVIENPFPAVGETCTICISCADTTTTTTVDNN